MQTNAPHFILYKQWTQKLIQKSEKFTVIINITNVLHSIKQKYQKRYYTHDTFVQISLHYIILFM